MTLETLDAEQVGPFAAGAAEPRPDEERRVDPMDTVRRLGPRFAARAQEHDENGTFVAQNYAEMREAGLFSLGVPESLGGGGASHSTLVEVVREIARHDGSTALAYAMHVHPLAVNVFKHIRGDARSTASLRKIATDELIIAGTGATDWLGSSGTAERVDGGFRVHADKRFVSGSSGGDLFVTSARYQGPDGPEVIHFAVPFADARVHVSDSWNAHGMRGTGSNNVSIDALFVPDESIVARRPADVWHPMWNAILPVALPLIVAAYVGLAEVAADLATEAAAEHQTRPVADLGAMLTQLTLARMALTDMVRLASDYDFEPTVEAADSALKRKTIATEAVKCVTESAADLVGGAGFMKGHPMERILRDVRAMHYHPLPARKQRHFTGTLALGMDAT